MTLLGYAYGAAAMLVVVIAFAHWLKARRKERDCGEPAAAILLACLWCVSNSVVLIASAMHVRSVLLMLPLTDLTALLTVIGLYRLKRARWKLGLCFTFLAQLTLHFVFWIISDRTPLIEWRYLTALDVIYCIQLLLVAFPGVAHGLAYLSRRVALGRVSAVGGAQ